jgi:hypothetical protein
VAWQSQDGGILLLTHKILLPFASYFGREVMRDKKENGAAKMAWDLFEKTGSISYYMLYYELMRK